MEAKFWETTKDGQKLVAILTYDNGQITGKPVGNGKDILVKNILSDHVVVKGKIIKREDNPEAWFRGLPYQYDGTYLRAGLVE
jgi:hypothetical protein